MGKRKWDLLIFASGIDIPDENGCDAILDSQNAVLQLFLHILQYMIASPGCVKRLAVLTVDSFAEETDIHEEVGLSLVTHSTLFGFCNTARQELIDVPLQFIDLEWACLPETMVYVASEIFCTETFGRNSVRILNRGRYVCRQVSSKEYEMPKKDFEGKFSLPEEGHIIGITGGNGALGLVMGEWLLMQVEKDRKKGISHSFTILFLSRSMKISDQNMPRWKQIKAKANTLNIEVDHAKCDCGDRAAVQEFIQEHTPNIGGIIHSAGVLQDALLHNQTWEKFDTVFASKSRAAMYLHYALEEYPNPNLKFFWVFSSTSVFGNNGQSNYSASNSYLDGLTRHRRAIGLPSTAIQWGAWGEVGMAANLDQASKKKMENSPMPAFANEDGLRGLELGLSTGLPYFSVFRVNPQIIAGMLHQEASVLEQYSSNFFSKLAPLPPPKEVSEDNAYRHLYGWYQANERLMPVEDRLVHNAWTLPYIDENE
uniref:Ketoreductase domain-containing protein n=2 Tax=Noctiluca scintillans TaxID=2966 RepID=A0A7S1ANZ7_NOCSC|mmetsp:Transcript_53850/g.144162  ORF Transcript_53850/g.144162 Transcript_53850/m.144162 type:complete len:483 (+) Transcript_53850:110-1558(+)